MRGLVGSVQDVMVIEIYSGDALLEKRCVDLDSWYESCIIDDVDDDVRAEMGITRIEGTKFDGAGQLQAMWCNYYDSDGSLGRSVIVDE